MHVSGAYRPGSRLSKFSGEESLPSMAALFGAVNGTTEKDWGGNELDNLYSVKRIFDPPWDINEEIRQECSKSKDLNLPSRLCMKDKPVPNFFSFIPAAPLRKEDFVRCGLAMRS
jgi:hypothetical protein